MICGRTICRGKLLKTTTSPGFTKLMRTAQDPLGVTLETTTDTVVTDVTSQRSAGTEHTDAEHACVNFKKFIPYTVTELPGNVFSGRTPPKLRFVNALASSATPSMTWTNRFFDDCGKETYTLQLPCGVVEFMINSTSVNDVTAQLTAF